LFEKERIFGRIAGLPYYGNNQTNFGRNMCPLKELWLWCGLGVKTFVVETSSVCWLDDDSIENSLPSKQNQNNDCCFLILCSPSHSPINAQYSLRSFFCRLPYTVFPFSTNNLSQPNYPKFSSNLSHLNSIILRNIMREETIATPASLNYAENITASTTKFGCVLNFNPNFRRNMAQ
jgi:hypothetical protein